MYRKSSTEDSRSPLTLTKQFLFFQDSKPLLISFHLLTLYLSLGCMELLPSALDKGVFQKFIPLNSIKMCPSIYWKQSTCVEYYESVHSRASRPGEGKNTHTQISKGQTLISVMKESQTTKGVKGEIYSIWGKTQNLGLKENE